MTAKTYRPQAADILLLNFELSRRPSGERVPNVERLIRELSPRVSLLTLDVKLPVRASWSLAEKWAAVYVAIAGVMQRGRALQP